MGFWDRLLKSETKESRKDGQESEDNAPLDVLNAKESGEVDELLSKLYLLQGKIIQLHDHYIKELLAVHGVVSHPDMLKSLFEYTKHISNLSGEIEQDSYLAVETAQQIKERLMADNGLHGDNELLPKQAKSFSTVIDLAPRLKMINDTFTYCLFTIEEIEGQTGTKTRFAHEEGICQDIQAVSHKLEDLMRDLTEIISALSHISQLDHEYNQEWMKRDIEYELKLENEDIDHLLHIFSTSYHILKDAHKKLDGKDGRAIMREALEQRIMYNLQKALRYDEALQKAVKDVCAQVLGLDRVKNADLAVKQEKLTGLAEGIRETFVSLNTQTVPRLVDMLYDKEKRPELDATVKSILQTFSALYHKIKLMRELIEHVSTLHTREERFEMGVND